MFSSMKHQTSTFNEWVNLQDLFQTHFHHHFNYCLFLDIDGTISEFHPDPQSSFVAPTTLSLIEQLGQHNISVSVLTGRSLKDAKRLLSPLNLNIAGTHGLEIETVFPCFSSQPSETQIFDILYLSLQQQLSDFPKVFIERKPYAIALHYRAQPDLSVLVDQIAYDLVQQHSNLKLNHGKCVVEIILNAADKGQALTTLYQHLNLKTAIPVFLGDDLTDESAFRVVNHMGGISIKVGEGSTEAKFRIKNVNESHQFLSLFLEFIQNKKAGLSQVSKINGEKACLN